jgi:hypothetical protein
MARRRFTVVLVLVAIFCSGIAALAGCADEDPKYGPPEAIRGRKIDYGTGVSADEPAAEGGVATAQSAFKALFDSIDKTCNDCHTTGRSGAKKFFGANAEATRTIFKTEGYTTVTSAFYTKPQHLGPPLDAAQKKLFEAWIALEAGGTPAAPDGGG